MLTALRLAVGTLTAFPVGAIAAVTPPMARRAMLLAPLAAVPVGLLAAAVVALGAVCDLPPLLVGFAAVGALALGSRALHLDGLSDTADGLTASYDRERSLAVMKGGTAGPAGVTALVVVLGAQAAAIDGIVTTHGAVRSATVVGVAVCASRAALWICTASVVPPARPDGLGSTFTRTVPVPVAVLGVAGGSALAALFDPVVGPVTVLAAAVVVTALVRRTVLRFGGVTGDVFGAAIELCLLVLLTGATLA